MSKFFLLNTNDELHGVCKRIPGEFIMYLQRKLESPELIDLLVIHTNRLTQMMIYGETYPGEYEVCRRTIELIQNEIVSRNSIILNAVL